MMENRCLIPKRFTENKRRQFFCRPVTHTFMKNINRIPVLIWILTLIVISGCMQDQSYSEEEVASELRNQWNTFIAHWEAEEADEMVAMYTEDAVHIPPSMEINSGRDKIYDFYSMLFANNLSSAYEHDILGIQHEGNSAIEQGSFTVNWVRNDSTEWTFRARSLTHWMRNEEGTWQIKSFIFNLPPGS